jgi:hypothetical protein
VKGTAYFQPGSTTPYMVISEGGEMCPWCLGRGHTYGLATTVPIACDHCRFGFLGARIDGIVSAEGPHISATEKP